MKLAKKILKYSFIILILINLQCGDSGDRSSSSDFTLTLDLTNEAVNSSSPYTILVFQGTTKKSITTGTLTNKQKNIVYTDLTGECHFYIWINDDNNATYDNDELGASVTTTVGIVTGITLNDANFATVVWNDIVQANGGFDDPLICYFMPPSSNDISGIHSQLVSDDTQVEQYIKKSQAAFSAGSAITDIVAGGIDVGGIPIGTYAVFGFVDDLAPFGVLNTNDYVSITGNNNLSITGSVVTITLTAY